MALMLAGRVVEIRNGKAIVDVEGQLKEASLEFIKDVKPGDYVKMYYGIVLEKVSKEEAEETLARCSYHHSSSIELTFTVSNFKF
ncbi:HypC/HybG/HupF family hydrogenase formation chaperone [Thermococcus sp. Bubb.Bath]|uniref:HypC/HybG/HupF family hydrogenase formation chaperone n=1 Tax=Thermococcus sp. Bubb.Bath TaxID=1638242 RepID=UPI00143C52C6|nr:HypC/HybG/HupF family hydrogenase formation chaperone [Thermococcus sp. Bubb.Bath]NJF25803.1 HypC/HybG/HupF family hydrogenase formation chaperone [Thermococcus sp. Bubb.Bath]